MTPRSIGNVDPDRVRDQVRKRYAPLASGSGCCGSSSDSTECCGGDTASLELGYSADDLSGLPEGSHLGLGCGNPVSLVSLRPGEVVLDLGSGAGVDCFLASRKVGPRGHVIGVDMTPEMLTKARANARQGGFDNVEFRLGEIEHLPVADQSIDVVLSNCVINLAPDKERVYHEAFRVLAPGGRLAVSDVVATRRIAAKERADPSLWSSCSSGAIGVGRLRSLLGRVGFRDVRIDLDPGAGSASSLQGQSSLGVVPARICGLKPKAGLPPSLTRSLSRAV